MRSELAGTVAPYSALAELATGEPASRARLLGHNAESRA